MKRFAFLLPILAGISWGSVGIFVRKLTDLGMNNITILSTRVLFATILLFIIYLIFNKNLLKINPHDLWIFLCSGTIGMLALNCCYNEAINALTLSFAAILLALAPMFVIIFSAIFFHEKITAKKTICLILAIAGCICTSGIIENHSDITFSWYGILNGLAAGMFYAFYLALSKFAIKKGYNALTITFYSLLVMTISLFFFTDWQSAISIVKLSPVKLSLFMALHSFVSSICPYFLHTHSLSYLETGKAAILAESEPVSAMIFGLIIFGEVPTLIGMFGFILILTSLTLLSLKTEKC